MSPYRLADGYLPAGLDAPESCTVSRALVALPALPTDEDWHWIRGALPQLAASHDRVLILIEADLMGYESVTPADRVNDETIIRWHELVAMRNALPPNRVDRVSIAAWPHFIDPTFATLWRRLLVAFSGGGSFREDLQRIGRMTLRRATTVRGGANRARAGILCEIERLAMRLRVAEVAGYTHEYGRCEDGLVARRLYAGAYETEGLTVNELTGLPARRAYRRG